MDYSESEILSVVEPDKEKEKSEIRFLSACTAAAVIGYVILSYAYSFLVRRLGLQRFLAGTQLKSQLTSFIVTLFVILVPFLISGCFAKKKTGVRLIPLKKPENLLTAILSVPSGVMFCILGSVATSVISAVVSRFGATLTQPDISAPPTRYALVVYIIRLTLSAALIEEICFRGIVMQPLRKHGDLFAVGMSAFVFAIMHGNLVQAPAAVISGFAIGYFTVVTGTIWTGVIIHLLNNLLVAAEQYYLSAGNSDVLTFLTGPLTYALILIGGVCAIAFFAVRKRSGSAAEEKASSLNTSEKLSAFFLNPAMLLMILLMVYSMTGYIQK